jgi:diguanylate cyclase (GGDEF)-like protein/PAS domain S-box-containing protein
LIASTANRMIGLCRERGASPALIFCVTGALVGVVARLSLYFGHFAGCVPAIWPVNALPLAMLLTSRPRSRRFSSIVIASSIVGIFAAAVASGATVAGSVQFGVANGLEIGAGCIAAWLPFGPTPRLRRLDGLIKMIVAIGIVGPAVGALVGTCDDLFGNLSHYIATWQLCFASHALGNLIFTSGTIVVLNRARSPWQTRTTPLSAILALALCIILLALILRQNSVIGLFFLPLLFAFLGLIAGFELSCIGVTGLVIMALFPTTMGYGPFITLEPHDITAQLLVLQSLIGASFLISAPITLVGERRGRMIAILRRQKTAIISRAAQYKVLADTSADTILVTLQDGTILYASRAAERLIGIAGSALAGRSAFDLIHPDDKNAVRTAMTALGGKIHEITTELRLQHEGSTSPIWTEVRSRIGDRRADLNVEIVSVVRDISARRVEDERRNADLIRLDMLANTDTLTGLANRRRFNDHLDQEWRRALREQLDIALILIDVDLFKAYNDCYGHPTGDIALRRLANVVGIGALRPSDLATRIGGEEFAVILPATFLSGARAVAERIRDGVRDLQIIHDKSPSGILSVSIGIDCVCPSATLAPQSFIERADRALYRAKARRGSIVIAT